MTQPEGQTARDVFPEDDGIPEIADDTPEAAAAEDPQFAPEMGAERANASVDFGTTAVGGGVSQLATNRFTVFATKNASRKMNRRFTAQKYFRKSCSMRSSPGWGH